MSTSSFAHLPSTPKPDFPTISAKEILARSRRTIATSSQQLFRMADKGFFPKVIRVSPKKFCWRRDEVERWFAEKNMPFDPA